MARRDVLETQLEVERTVARLFGVKAEFDRKHQAIAEKIEAVQNELRLSVIDMHKAARMNAMGHSIIEKKNLPMQYELRMESHLQEMCSQVQTIGAVSKNIHSQTENVATKNSLHDTDTLPSKPSTKIITL